PDLGYHVLTSRVKSFLTSHRNLVSTGREVFLLLSGLFVQGLLEDQGKRHTLHGRVRSPNISYSGRIFL
ncbi:MAG: hypothetical protein ABIJ96_15220, partial [Elusimicrobiota bacterium]